MVSKSNVQGNTLPRMRKSSRALAEHIRATLAEEKPMTLRGLYYRLASAGQIPATPAGYKKLMRIAGKMRESGDIPLRGWIVDRIRSTLKPSSWSGLADFGETVADAYRKDFWSRMPCHVEIFVEKDAIAGVLQPVTEEYDVRLNVIRGDVSIGFAGEIAGLWNGIRKPIHAAYLGDRDPAGLDIERVLREKLHRYSGREATWKRLGVLPTDPPDLDLLPLPVKLTSSRAAGYIRQHGHECYEVDAIPPGVLRARVRDFIDMHIDQDEWDRLMRIERLERESVIGWVDGLSKSDLGPFSDEGGAV